MPDPAKLPRFFTIKQIVAATGLPERALRSEIRAGRLRCFRAKPMPGTPVLLRWSDLEAWLDKYAGQRQRVPAPRDLAG